MLDHVSSSQPAYDLVKGEGIVEIAPLSELDDEDLADLCLAAEEAILEGGGFGWITPPDRQIMEQYWRGILLVPTVYAWVVRLDGILVGSIQLRKMPTNNEAQAHIGQINTEFVSPRARGHKLARKLLHEALIHAGSIGLRVIRLDVRATQTAAIRIYQSFGFSKTGENPYYALVDNDYIKGYEFTLCLDDYILPKLS